MHEMAADQPLLTPDALLIKWNVRQEPAEKICGGSVVPEKAPIKVVEVELPSYTNSVSPVSKEKEEKETLSRCPPWEHMVCVTFWLLE